jgi:hypothetical protein
MAINTKINLPSVVASMAVTDFALLLIMLVGLQRIRRESGCTYGLTEFIWKQVCLHFSLTMSIPVH